MTRTAGIYHAVIYVMHHAVHHAVHFVMHDLRFSRLHRVLLYSRCIHVHQVLRRAALLVRSTWLGTHSDQPHPNPSL